MQVTSQIESYNSLSICQGIKHVRKASFYSTGSNFVTGSGNMLILFLIISKEEKKIVLIKQDLVIETPMPEYILRLKNSIFGTFTGCPLGTERQFRWKWVLAVSMGYI